MAELELKPRPGKEYTKADLMWAAKRFAPLGVTAGLRGQGCVNCARGSLVLYGDAPTLRSIAEQLHRMHLTR